jgi:tetratricopeptide (TPR) repeat protein
MSMRKSCVVAASLACVAAAGPAGFWDGLAGKVEIEMKGDAVTGKLAQPGGCPLPAGTEVIKGSVLEDSVMSQVRLCVVEPKCGEQKGWADALLLFGKKGQLLSGVAAAEQACAAEAGEVRLVRGQAPAPASAPAAAPAPAEPERPIGVPQPEGTYDPRMARTAQQPSKKAKDILRDAANYLQEGKFEKAQKRFLEVVKMAPEIPEAYNGVGVTHYARQDYEKAIEWYKKAIEVEGDFGDAFYNLACSYALVGKKSMALRYLKLAAMKDFTSVDQLEQDTDLVTLRDEPDFKALVEQARNAPAAK